MKKKTRIKKVDKKKKRNPQDTTLRNVRAANKKLDELDIKVDNLFKERNQDRRNNSHKLELIRTALRESGADSNSQEKSFLRIKEILGW
jgi:hypothetical protein